MDRREKPICGTACIKSNVMSIQKNGCDMTESRIDPAPDSGNRNTVRVTVAIKSSLTLDDYRASVIINGKRISISFTIMKCDFRGTFTGAFYKKDHTYVKHETTSPESFAVPVSRSAIDVHTLKVLAVMIASRLIEKPQHCVFNILREFSTPDLLAEMFPPEHFPDGAPAR